MNRINTVLFLSDGAREVKVVLSAEHFSPDYGETIVLSDEVVEPPFLMIASKMPIRDFGNEEIRNLCRDALIYAARSYYRDMQMRKDQLDDLNFPRLSPAEAELGDFDDPNFPAER